MTEYCRRLTCCWALVDGSPDLISAGERSGEGVTVAVQLVQGGQMVAHVSVLEKLSVRLSE